jgi:hypothetical protein
MMLRTVIINNISGEPDASTFRAELEDRGSPFSETTLMINQATRYHINVEGNGNESS